MKVLGLIVVSGIAQGVLVIQYEWSSLGAYAFVMLIMTATILVDSPKVENSLASHKI